MKEQIEEMAKVIHDSDIADINTFPISMSECLGRHGARRTGAAIALVNAGYRKQSDGEWVTKGDIFYVFACSVCGGTVDFKFQMTPYCPNCGARMKGGGKE